MSQDSGSARFPRLWIPLAFRAAVAGIFCMPVVQVIVWLLGTTTLDLPGQLLLAEGLVLAIFLGIPSLILAVALAARARWAAWLAVAGDAVVSPVLIAILISAVTKIFVRPPFGILDAILGDFCSRYSPAVLHGPGPQAELRVGLGAGLLGIMFLAEGVYLVHKLHGRKLIWIPCAAVFTAILLGGLVPRWLEARAFDPLLAHVNEHFIEIPRGSTISRGESELMITTPDRDLITIQLDSEDRPWRFVGWESPEEGYSCLEAQTDTSYSNRVQTADDALKLIRAVGVTDPDLRLTGKTVVFGDCPGFAFWSPRARGTYVVVVKGWQVFLFLRDPATIE